MILSSVKKYVALAIGAVAVVVAVTFFFLWKSTNDDLVKETGKLKTATEAVTTLKTTVDELRADAELKSSLNLQLAVDKVILEDEYREEVTYLKSKIDELSRKNPNATVTIDSTKYVEEVYVEEVTELVLGSMWDNYCTVTKSCPEGSVP